LLVGVVVLAASAAVAFRAPYQLDRLVVRDGVRTARLSDYHPALAGTPFDTEVYHLEGPEPGGTVLVMGGVHANEPAGTLAAVVLLERAVVERGRLIVVTHANASAFTHNAAGQAAPQSYSIPTPWGARTFRYGDRLSNPVHQYPDPEVHHHYPSDSLGSGQEARNLNRNFPGRPDGTATEQVAYALAQVVRTEEVDLVVDLHEARPMNPIVNAVVVHQRAGDVGALAVADLEALEGVSMRLELSPDGFQGVSQRELGEHTDALTTLSETPNVAMDFVRGRTDAALVTDGRDPLLARAAAHPGLVYVPYDDAVGLPIGERVGRHLAVVTRLASVFGEFHPESAVTWSGVPSYREVVERGLGAFLADPDAP
jgi:hypothetical protein